MDDKNSVVRLMRMRIDFRRFAMGRPTSVCNANFAFWLFRFHFFFQKVYFAQSSEMRDIALNMQSNSCRIIASIFHFIESLDKKLTYASVSCCCNNSTHYFFFIFLCLDLPKASLSAGTSLVTTDPAPIILFCPILIGAIKELLEPIKAPLPTLVLFLFLPS